MKNRGSYLLCAIVIGLLFPLSSYGFGNKAHENLSLRAVDPNVANASLLDSFLQNVLPFEFEYVISEGKSIAKLISEGSVQEDSPGTRVLHHFHDPTRTWDQAGARFGGIPLGNSSVVWSQMFPQGACCGNFAWRDARDAYFNALTGTTKSARKFWYDQTFRTLGHLIHHVQDAADPSHTRNDTHFQPVRSTKFPDADPFHHWADSPVGQSRINSVAEAQRFEPSLLDQSSPNPLAPVPISRIIDKTDGDLGILSPNLNIGLAEYSNANFISKGTARSTSYLYPTYSQLEFPIDISPSGRKRRYARFRAGFGEQDYRVGVSSRMALFVNSTVPPDAIDFGLDDNVHDDYGRKLFPRAVGYSAGLIDYFFRGQIDSTWPYYSSILVPWEQRPTSLTVENVQIKIPGEGPQTGEGTMQMVLLHRNTFTGSPGYPPLSPGPKPEVVVSDEVPFRISDLGQSVTFPFSSLPFPTIAPETFCCYGHMYMGIIIYRGTLGQEKDTAVVASGYCQADGYKWERFYSFERDPTMAYIGEC